MILTHLLIVTIRVLSHTYTKTCKRSVGGNTPYRPYYQKGPNIQNTKYVADFQATRLKEKETMVLLVNTERDNNIASFFFSANISISEISPLGRRAICKYQNHIYSFQCLCRITLKSRA